MATTKMELTGVIDGKKQTIAAEATIDDAVLPHFFDAYRRNYGQVNDGTVEEPKMRDMTDAETFQVYAKGIANGTIAQVQMHLRAKAHEEAEAAIPEITVTAKD